MRPWLPVLTLTLAAGAAAAACGGGAGQNVAPDGGPDAPAGPLWSARPPISTGYLQAVWGSGDDVYAAGMSPMISHSGDRGSTWDLIDSGVQADTGWPHFTHLAGSDGGDVWAVGASSADESVLVHSADHGGSWQTVAVGAVDKLQAVWAFDHTTVLVASYDAGVARSEDAGATWTRHDAEPGTVLFGLWASGPNDVYATGGVPPPGGADGGSTSGASGASITGVILHSADGGVSWTRVLTAPTGALWNAWGTPDGAAVYAGGAAGTIAWTTDHGATWQTNGRSDPNTAYDLDDVWVSPNGGAPYFTSLQGIIRSIETPSGGGATVFSAEPLPASNGRNGGYINAFAIWGTADDDVWAVGPGGSLWHRP
jgi:hypothetical protein